MDFKFEMKGFDEEMLSLATQTSVVPAAGYNATATVC
jgi:hypothetical protein